MAWVFSPTILLAVGFLSQAYLLSVNASDGTPLSGKCSSDREFFCESFQKCVDEAYADQCPDLQRNSTCGDGQFFCPSFQKCVDKAYADQCPDLQRNSTCGDGQFFCQRFGKCMDIDIADQCPDGHDIGTKYGMCERGQKHCPAINGSRCIPVNDTCDCGEGRGYCESIQRCLPLEGVSNGFECPSVCTVKGERYCPFSKRCIPRDRLCHCPSGKRGCATLKACIGSDEKCPCPTGHTYCANNWRCLPDSETCPSCTSGQFFCPFKERCVPTGTPCGCPAETKFCPYRRSSDVPACVNITREDMCSCPETLKPCLSLLKCIPKEKSCPCPEGTENCESSGDCVKVGHCPREDCPPDQIFCRRYGKCMEVMDYVEYCGHEEHNNCSKGEFYCHRFRTCMLEADAVNCSEGERCEEGTRHCASSNGSRCISVNDSYVYCGLERGLCGWKQHCLAVERLDNGFDVLFFCPSFRKCVDKAYANQCPDLQRNSTCADGQFFCASFRKCVDKAYADQCPDLQRNSTCADGQFFCASFQKCVDKAYADQCPDLQRNSTCADGQFFCASFQKCVDKAYANQCPDLQRNSTCADGQFFCPSFQKCVDKAYADQCPDLQRNSTCADGQFFCPSFRKCVDKAYANQCPDLPGSIEQRNDTCADGQFFCPSFRKCVDDAYADQCPDLTGNIEQRNETCADGQFFCPSFRKCVDKAYANQCPDLTGNIEQRNSTCDDRQLFCRHFGKCIDIDIADQCPDRQRNSTCADGQFFCASFQKCVDKAYADQCPDLQRNSTCADGQFFCASFQKCVDKAYANQCPDLQRNSTCADGQFFCPSFQKCVDKAYADQCPDLQRNSTCADGQFFCPSFRKCVDKAYANQCPDLPGSIEQRNDTCADGQFFCPSFRKCVDDAYADQCPDLTGNIEQRNETCADGQFFCPSFRKCVDKAYANQCPDLTGNIEQRNSTCDDRQLFCRHFGKCIDIDIADQCPDRQRNSTCADGQFFCASFQKCVDKAYANQCLDLQRNDTCADGQFFCPSFQKCVDKAYADQCPDLQGYGTCGDGQFFCPSFQKCVDKAYADQCPDLQRNDTCADGQFFCPSFRKCVDKAYANQCPDLTGNIEQRNDTCDDRQLFCRHFGKCIDIDIADQCPDRPDIGMNYGMCARGQKHCPAINGSRCISVNDTCDCGEGRGYCESKQRCLPLEDVGNGFECPSVCTVKGERYCPFSKRCIPRDRLCHCPSGERGCATLKACIGSDEKCPCPTGHTYCANNWRCLPDSETCPSCTSGQFFCPFKERCVPTGTPCGCPAETEFCPYRRSSDVPACVNITRRDLCSCPDTKKPCLSLLKCIPKEKSCPCPEGTEYCESSGDCVKAGHCLRKGCPPDQPDCQREDPTKRTTTQSGPQVKPRTTPGSTIQPTTPKSPRKKGDFLFLGEILSNIPDERNPGKSLKDFAGFEEAKVVEQLGNVGKWQVGKPDSKGGTQWANIERGTSILKADKLRFQPSKPSLHGFDGIHLIVNGVEKYIGILVLPCITPKLTIKKVLIGEEDVPLKFNLDDVVEITRVNEGSSILNLVKEYKDDIPKSALEAYKGLLQQPLNESLGLNVLPLLSKVGLLEEQQEKKVAPARKTFTSTRKPEPKIFPKGSKLVFKPAQDYVGIATLLVRPVDVSPTVQLRTVSDKCAVGSELGKIFINLTNVNDRPTVRLNQRRQPMLNIEAPSLPYKLEKDSDNEGFLVRYVGMKVGEDRDGDALGIAVVDARRTKIGEWQFLERGGTWKAINVEDKTNDDGGLEGDTAELLFLSPDQKIRFKPLNNKLWSAFEAIDHTTIRFVLWDQSDKLTPGKHSVALRGNSGISKQVISCTILRRGCDGKPGSMKEVNECNRCGEKTCKKCDGGLNSTAFINDCGHCVLGSTNKPKRFGIDCKNSCSGEYIMNTACKLCQKRGDRSFIDCAGNCRGTARVDDCGKCGGDGSTCAGCDGVPNSGKVLDSCNKCKSPEDPDFNTSCVSTVLPKSIPSGREQTIQITKVTTIPKDMTCELRSKGIRVKATKIESEDGKSLKLTLPAINSLGMHDVICTVGGVEYFEHLKVSVYDSTAKVTKVEPSEIDEGSDVTEVLVTGTGFVDTGRVYCVFEVEAAQDDLSSGLRSSFSSNKKRSMKAKGEFISDTQIRCKVVKMKRALRVKLSVSFSRKYQVDSSVPLTWYANAPQIVNYELNYRYKQVLVRFNRPVKGISGCEKLFTIATMTTLRDLAGEKKFTCHFKRPDVLLIKLPVDVILRNNITLYFKSEAIKADEPFSRTKTHELTIAVPAQRPLPVAVITAPARVGFCDSVKVSGRNSRNTGGRKFECSWSVDVNNESALTQEVKTNLADIRRKLGRVKSCLFKFRSEDLHPGMKYTLNLQVTVGNDKSKNVSQSIERSEDKVPTINLLTRLKTFDMSRSLLRLRVTARGSKCLNNSLLEYSWTSVSHPDLNLPGNKTKRLMVPRKYLECDTNYTFNVRAYMASNPRLYSSLTLDITTKAAPLKTKILGGDRVIPASGKFRLKARTSTKGTCKGVLRYIFSCVDAEGLACLVTGRDGIRKLLEFTDLVSAEVKLDASQFKSNKTYTFKLEVSKGNQKAETSVKIKIAAGNPPIVKTQNPKKSKENPILDGRIITSAIHTLFQWQCVSELGLGFIDLSNRDKLLSGQANGSFGKPITTNRRFYTRRLMLRFKPGVLELGVEYKFRLIASSQQAPDESGESIATIATNAPPVQGNIIIEPQEGVSQNTSFSISASGFDDDDLPLKYQFYYEKEVNGRISKNPLGVEGEQSAIDVTLPSGDDEDDFKLKLFVRVRDALGATTFGKAVVKVKRKEINSEDFDKLAEDISKLAGAGEHEKLLSGALSFISDVEKQNGTEGDTEKLKELKANMAESVNAALFNAKSDPEKGLEIFELVSQVEVESEEDKRNIADRAKEVVSASTPKNVEKARVATRSTEVTLSRRRRASGDEILSEEDEESTGITSEEAENVLATFENLVDVSVINNVTQTFLETVDDLLIGMCQNAPLGTSLMALSSMLGTLKSDMNYMDDVDQIFLNVSTSHGLINNSALVMFGSELKNWYNEWNCSGQEELCNGVCATMVQYPYDFITADNSSDRRSDVVFLSLKNPETFDHISVNGLTQNVVVRIPLHSGNSANGGYQCKILDNSNAQWSTSGCQKTRVFSQDAVVFVECSCSRLGYITVHGETTDSESSSQQTSTLVQNTSTEPKTESPSTTEPPRLTASVSFSFDVNYDSIVRDSSIKKELENLITKELANVMKVDASFILNVTISKGSIIVSFVLLAPDQNPSTSLNYSISQLQTAVDKGQFIVLTSDGIQITADNGTVVYSYRMVSGVKPREVAVVEVDEEEDSVLSLILGCVFGGILIIVVIIIIVLYMCVFPKKSKVSHQDLRSSGSLKNNCVENTQYQGVGYSMDTIGKKEPVQQTASVPERPPTAGSRIGSAGLRQTAELPNIE